MSVRITTLEYIWNHCEFIHTFSFLVVAEYVTIKPVYCDFHLDTSLSNLIKTLKFRTKYDINNK